MIPAGTTYDTPLTDFNFTTLQINTLAHHNIVTVGDVMHEYEKANALRGLRGVGVTMRAAMVTEVIGPWLRRKAHYAKQTK